MSQDHYKVLGVSKTATQDEIKKQYRKLAMKHHPDRNNGDADAEKLFKEISIAYDVLSDPAKRAEYDNPSPFGGGNPFGGNPFGGNPFGGGPFGDPFGGFGGFGGQQSEPLDLHYKLQVTLEEAHSGTTKQVKYNRRVKCSPCGGRGTVKSSDVRTCGTCGGHGIQMMQQGPFVQQVTCHTCKGKGSIISNPCNVCHGEGYNNERVALDINIPQCISERQLHIPGAGNFSSKANQTGGLYVDVGIIKHEKFERKGIDLVCEIESTYDTLCLGGSTQVNTLDGTIAVTIAPGTQTGSIIRIKGKGMRDDKRSGNLLCVVKCIIPTNLTEKQIELITALRDVVESIEE